MGYQGPPLAIMMVEVVVWGVLQSGDRRYVKIGVEKIKRVQETKRGYTGQNEVHGDK